MANSLKNMLIGIFFLGSIAVFIALVMFLRPKVGDERETLFVRFSNINKINVGTRVLFAGKAVGEVAQINQIYHARETQPSDPLGRLYFYQLTLKVDSKVKVYTTDEISIQTSGLLGEKSIGIIPKAPPPGVMPQLLTEKTPYYADSIDPIENTFSRFSDISQKLEDTVDLVKTWLEHNSANLARAVSSFGCAMDQVDLIGRQIHDKELVAQVKEGAEKFTHSMGRVDAALSSMEEEGAFKNASSVLASLKGASSNLDRISEHLNSGTGTLGKLIQADDMYLRLSAILSKADTLMNDVNHYGVLFHLNKGWQRMRTKRLNTLNALKTPADFKAYFQEEIDQINTSMSRLSILIDKAQDASHQAHIVDNPQFKQDFAELLRHIDEMSDNLKLYNEQLMEKGAP